MELDISSTSELQKILQNKNVDVAYVDKNNHQKAQSIDRQVLIEKAKIQEQAGEVAKIVNYLSWEDRFEWVTIHKVQGNYFYKHKQYQKAYEYYMKAIMGIDLDQKNGTQRINKVKIELQLPLLNNIAQCEFQQQHYAKAISLYKMAINIDDSIFKTYYQIIKSFIHLNQIVEAKNYYQIAVNKVNDNQSQQQLLQELKLLLVKQENQQKQIYQKMFNQQSQQQQQQQQQQLYLDNQLNDDEDILIYDDEWQDLDDYGLLKYVIYPIKQGYQTLLNLLNCKKRNNLFIV